MGIIGDIGGLFLQGVGTVGGLVNAQESNRIDNENLLEQQLRNQQNYDSEVEQQAYDRDLQQTIFDREDSSVSRRVSDLKNAGLSPVLAAGQGARAGAPISSQAPKQTPSQRGQTGKQMNAANMAQMVGMGQVIKDMSKTSAETKLIQLQQEQTKAQTERIKQDYTQKETSFPLQMENMLNNNSYLKQTLESRVNQIINQSDTSGLKYLEQKYKTTMTGYDAEYARAMQQYLQTGKATYVDPYTNKIKPFAQLPPAILRIVAEQMTLDIKKYNKTWYETMNLPTDITPTKELQISGAVINTIKDLVPNN